MRREQSLSSQAQAGGGPEAKPSRTFGQLKTALPHNAAQPCMSMCSEIELYASVLFPKAGTSCIRYAAWPLISCRRWIRPWPQLRSKSG